MCCETVWPCLGLLIDTGSPHPLLSANVSAIDQAEGKRKT